MRTSTRLYLDTINVGLSFVNIYLGFSHHSVFAFTVGLLIVIYSIWSISRVASFLDALDSVTITADKEVD